MNDTRFNYSLAARQAGSQKWRVLQQSEWFLPGCRAMPENPHPAGCSAVARWPMNPENTLRARDDFDDLRAERDMPTRYRNEPNRFAGLWKQIAIGIVVGYSVLGIISAVTWMLIAQVESSSLSITLP
ncbi:hypothetical protein [Ectopseudomonas khazarica]